ncbi:unnamed protein product, partial [Amoebophrya sp. A120]
GRCSNQRRPQSSELGRAERSWASNSERIHLSDRQCGQQNAHSDSDRAATEG